MGLWMPEKWWGTGSALVQPRFNCTVLGGLPPSGPLEAPTLRTQLPCHAQASPAQKSTEMLITGAQLLNAGYAGCLFRESPYSPPR